MSRVEALRELIKEHQCDAYLIPDSDGHYTFYSLLREDRRINWITECQAHCGLAMVTLKDGAFFEVPSNYRLLAKAELDKNTWTLVDNLPKCIISRQLSLTKIAYDPRLTPIFVLKQFSALASSLHSISSSTNWIDMISKNETSRERPKLTSIWPLDELRFAGRTSAEKMEKLRQNYLKEGEKTYTLVITAMDEIAWLLNLRANDMECNPLFYSFAVISYDRFWLFTDNPHKVRLDTLPIIYILLL